jgi:transaldolase
LTRGKSGEALFFELALEDLTRAAALFQPIHNQSTEWTAGVSLEVSPLLAYDTASTVSAAKALHAQAGRANLFIKIPGTKEGLPAIEEAIFAGNTSQRHPAVLARALPGRLPTRSCAVSSAGSKQACRPLSVPLPRCSSVAGIPPVAGKVPDSLRDQLGIAIAKRTYAAYRTLLGSPRWQRIFNTGAASPAAAVGEHGNQGPQGVRRPLHQIPCGAFTVNTMPEGTLKALADHGELASIFQQTAATARKVIGEFAKAGIDVDALAAQLQREGAKSFVDSWTELMAVISSKSAALKDAVVG